MKKIVLFILVLFMIPLFASCKVGKVELDFEAEFQRIYMLIPSTYSEDILLPSGEEPYTVKYQVDNEDLEGNVLSFELQPEDQDIELEIQISSGEEKEKYYITIIQIGNEELYSDIVTNDVFYKAFLKADAYIPSVATSNFTLHQFEEDDDRDVE